MKIAIIGTGIMGTGIGKTLISKGFEVSCYNRTAEHAQALVDAGAVHGMTLEATISEVSAVIMMPWSKDALDSVLLGAEGLFAIAQKDQVYIDMSTQLPSTGIWEARHFAEKGAEFLDAPVHGSKTEANNGGLWLMVGGDRDVYERMIPLFSAIGETHHYMGGHGQGFATKLCGNHLVSTIVAALGESLVLAKKAGLDPSEVLKVWMDSDFRSPVVGGVGDSMISRNFDVSFHLRTMVKDTELIRNFSESIQVPVLLSNIVHEVNKVGQNMGFGEENASAVVKVFERLAGMDDTKQ
jgi:3-hydroxyisobutyrate dehydrogenase-like beta-hydroxyacid dehydrogenase